MKTILSVWMLCVFMMGCAADESTGRDLVLDSMSRDREAALRLAEQGGLQIEPIEPVSVAEQKAREMLLSALGIQGEPPPSIFNGCVKGSVGDDSYMCCMFYYCCWYGYPGEPNFCQ